MKQKPKRICSDCGKLKRVASKANGIDLCSSCLAKKKKEICSKCGKLGRVAVRLPEGPICDSCYFDTHKEICSKCGKLKRVAYREGENVFCSNCGRKQEVCSGCGKLSEVSRRIDGQPFCASCYLDFNKGACRECGKEKRVSIKEGLCHNCKDKKVQEICAICGQFRRVRRRLKDGGAACYVCAPRLAAGFTIAQARAMALTRFCALCGREGPTDSDHEHGHCKHKNGCPLCYRGELCKNCNRGFLPVAEANPDLVSDKVKNYLTARPFAPGNEGQ